MPTTTFTNLTSEKQQRITEALNREFSTHPLAQAQVSRIIQDAKIPRGSFYKYFDDLQDAYSYLYQTAITVVHDPFQKVDFHDSKQIEHFSELMENYIQKMIACPYYNFFKMHFTSNESVWHNLNTLKMPSIADPVLWAIATLSHATVQEIMADTTPQTTAIKRLQVAITHFTKEAH